MLENLFTNVGGKIKTLVKVLFVLEAIAAVVVGLWLISVDVLAIIGIGIMIIGPFVVWILSWFVYGFGELVDRTCRIDEKLNPHASNSKATNQDSAELPDL